MKIKIIAIFLIVKILAFSLYLFFSFTKSSNFNLALQQLLQIGDSTNYMSIVSNGYDSLRNPDILHSYTNLPFFPVLPLLIKGLMYFGISPLFMILVNQFLMLMSALLLYIYINKNFDINVAFWASIFFIVSHIQAYSYLIYSENVFIFILLTVLIAIDYKRYWQAVLLAGILSGTRFIGFLSVIPLCFAKYKHSKFNYKTIFKLVITVALSCSGILCFAIYQKFHNGDMFAFYHAQAMWGRCDFSLLLNSPLKAIHLIFHANFIDKVFFIVYILAIYYFYKIRCYQAMLWLLILNLPAIISLRLLSFARFTASIPFIYLFFAKVLNKNSLWIKYLFLLTLLGLQLYYIYLLSINSTNLW